MFLGSIAFSLLATMAPVWAQPNFAQTLYERGRDAMTQGEPTKAIELLERAVLLQPQRAEYHYRLAKAAFAAGGEAGMLGAMPFAKKGRVHLERAVELDPELVEARFALLEFHLVAPALLGGSDSTAQEQAVEIRKRDAIEGYRASARIHTAAKKPHLARAEYAEMLRNHPTSARAHHHFALYLMNTEKNYAAAQQHFEAAVRLEPGYMPVWFRIGHLAALGGAPLPRGEEALQKYVSHRPTDDEPAISRAYYWLGVVYEKQGRKPQAKTAFAASLRINPHQKDVQAAAKRVS
jgi:tetratricopeptide (TPR) repeat protein